MTRNDDQGSEAATCGGNLLFRAVLGIWNDIDSEIEAGTAVEASA